MSYEDNETTLMNQAECYWQNCIHCNATLNSCAGQGILSSQNDRSLKDSLPDAFDLKGIYFTHQLTLFHHGKFSSLFDADLEENLQRYKEELIETQERYLKEKQRRKELHNTLVVSISN